MNLRIFLISGLLLLPGWANGQGNAVIEGSELGVSAQDIIGRLDLDVPDSPAFAILGIAPQNVINPDTPAELATALFVGDDSSGNSQEGIAIEFRPYLMALGEDITVGDYYNNQWLSRTALSFSQSKGVDEADRTKRQAIGLSFTPIDDRDPLTSRQVDNCLSGGIEKANANENEQRLLDAVRAATRELVDAQMANDEEAAAIAQAKVDVAEAALSQWLGGERKNLIEEHTGNCLKTHRKETINARQLQLGIAYHDSQVAGIDESGSAFWISYAMPLMDGSFTAHGRYSDDVVIADSMNAGQYAVKDESVLGIRYRQGDEKRAVLFEAAYIDEEDKSGILDDSYSTALVGAEFRLFESLWIQIALGETFGSNQDKDMALSGQFRWAVSKTRFWNGGNE